MVVELKRFFKHSSIYFIGEGINRIGVFILLPVYTNYLSTEEYGALELILVSIAFVRVFLGMRMGNSTIRFFFEYDDESSRKKLVSTSLIAVTFFSLILTSIFVYSSGTFSEFVFKTRDYQELFILGFCVMFFEATAEIPLAFLRAKEYSVLYIVTSSIQLFIRLGLNIYMVMFLEMGIKGVLIGNLIAAFVFWFILFIITFQYSRVSFDFSKFKDLWKYAWPLLLASVPSLFVGKIDRFFLSSYASLEAVGLYALAFRFGLAFRSFISEPFQRSYGPFRFSVMKNDNANHIYSSILTYYVLGACFIALTISLFSREIIELMTGPSYYESYEIVPIILIAMVGQGVVYILQTGILLKKKTILVTYRTIILVILNVILLYLLVPVYHIYGAALTFLLTVLVNMILTNYFSQKLYAIKYENGRILKLSLVAVSILMISQFFEGFTLVERVSSKVGILVSMFPLLLIMRFFSKDELKFMANIIKFRSLKSKPVLHNE